MAENPYQSPNDVNEWTPKNARSLKEPAYQPSPTGRIVVRTFLSLLLASAVVPVVLDVFVWRHGISCFFVPGILLFGGILALHLWLG
jgi:hypothetical protein